MTDQPASHDPRGPRLLLMGGSTATGLGVRGRSFGRLCAERLGSASVLDLTGSGPLIDEAMLRAEEIRQFRPDVALVCCGHAEVLVHPPQRFQACLERFAPASWHGVAGLQPRPYFSTSSSARRFRQRLTSWAKVRVKRGAMRLGSHQRMDLPDFADHLDALLALLREAGTRVLVVGTWPIDEDLFPRSNQAWEALAAVLREAAAKHGAEFVDPTPELDVWGDYLADHMHWSASGHERLAGVVTARIDVSPSTVGRQQ
ncbi:SGNH/GDSL hydrolase family protein [Nocardioides kribbensis]|uniref:GDSL-type esterase/lipase family protein n=1 Tax=Nocardioides kribbensis TaxID=305517 RepID=A0ABV1NXL0_9ACTN